MKKFGGTIIAILLVGGLFVLGGDALAFQASDTGITTSAQQAGFNTTGENSLPLLIGNIIRAFLLLIGLILMIVVLYGGIRYMLAGGNDEEVAKAKRWIINGIIGVIIITLAFAISSFVLQRIASAVNTTPPTSTPQTGT